MARRTWLITGAASAWLPQWRSGQDGEGPVQEIEPLGLRAFLVEPGSFRTGIETRSHFAGSVIDDYEATSGRFRKIMADIKPEQFPGDPAKAAAPSTKRYIPAAIAAI
jgi:hypothetical protein